MIIRHIILSLYKPHIDMRRILLTLILLVSALTISAEDRKSPITFDMYEWDFGTIDPADGTVCHTFTFTNKSKSAVRIAKDIPSCDCIMAFYDDETVEPGGKAEVMIAYSPKKDKGRSHRRVELLDVEGNTLASLSVEAEILDEGANAERKYPYLDVNLSFRERTENLISLLT